MLFSSLEALESRGCAGAAQEWERIATGLATRMTGWWRVARSRRSETFSLFVFENYLNQPAIFEAFCGMIVRHEVLAREVGANPSLYLADLGEAQQRLALEEAAANGGLNFHDAWANLRDF